jgi:hypothetical protein
MKDLKFRLLNSDEIEVRIGSIKEKGLTLLLYKDARVDMKMLDETVGFFGWQRDHKELKSNLYCGVGIFDEDKKEWIWKWDAGAESHTEAVKGEASDSFKRACVNWGIGRELYTSPFIWIPSAKVNIEIKENKNFCDDKFEVIEIGYNENREIKKLKINNKTTKEIIFELGKYVPKADEKKETPKPQEKPKPPETKQQKLLILQKEKNLTNEQILELIIKYAGEKKQANDLTDEQFGNVCIAIDEMKKQEILI